MLKSPDIFVVASIFISKFRSHVTYSGTRFCGVDSNAGTVSKLLIKSIWNSMKSNRIYLAGSFGAYIGYHEIQ
jgi:hypothetical protein